MEPDTEGLIGIISESTMVLVYKSPGDERYDFKNQQEISGFASTFIRYLLDFCQHVYAVTDETFHLNPDSSNPFKVKLNPSMTMS